MRTITKVVLLSLALGLVHASPSRASGPPDDFGVGLIAGEPTGVSGKLWMGSNAVQGSLAYSFDEFVAFTGDYLWHVKGLFGDASDFVRQLSAYYGAGGYLGLSTKSARTDSVLFAARIPFGVEWNPPAAPIGVGLELVPGLRLVPGTDIILQGGVMLRYYFE